MAPLTTTRHRMPSGRRIQPARRRRGTTPSVGLRATRRRRQATTFSRATAKGDGRIPPSRVDQDERFMSHHYSGPDYGFPHGDARLDLTDLFAFPKPGEACKSVLI